MNRSLRGFLGLAGLACFLDCRAPAPPPAPPATPTTALPPATATATVSPLPVETTPARSIYDRTPGVMHEEPGKRKRRVTPRRG